MWKKQIPIRAENAKQAAWLAPLASLGIFLLYLAVVQSIFGKYKNASLPEIMQDILGKIPGKAICLIIFVWLSICAAFNLRYFSERMVSTIFPNANILLFAITMSALVAYVSGSGLVVLARMNEIFFPAVIVIYFAANLLLTPELKPANLLPLTYKDIIPVLRGSTGITALWGYFAYMLMFAGQINNKEKIRREGGLAALFLTLLTTMIILFPLGVFGWQLVSKMPIPYYSTVKETSAFGIFSGVESLVVTIWMLTDFVLLSSLSLAAVHTLKTFIRFSDARPFVCAFITAALFMSMLAWNRLFDLEAFSRHIFVPVNIALGYGVPLLIFAAGKTGKKI